MKTYTLYKFDHFDTVNELGVTTKKYAHTKVKELVEFDCGKVVTTGRVITTTISYDNMLDFLCEETRDMTYKLVEHVTVDVVV